MKKLVCILGGYYPYFSPSSKMANNILLELKDEYEIIIIAQRNYFGLKKQEKLYGFSVYRINDYNRMFHHFFEGKSKSSKSGAERKLYKLLLSIKKTLYYLYRINRSQSYSKSYVNSVKKMLDKIDRQGKIDILFPVSTPHEAIIAACEYKKKNPRILVYPYKMDRFAIGNSLYETEKIRRKRYPKHLKTEINDLNICDKMFALPPIADYYYSNKDTFVNYSKVIKTDHPMLINLASENNDNSNDKRVKITYAGSLDKTLRNPTHILEIFSKIQDFSKNYVFNLYSFGNCQSIIDEYKKVLGCGLNDFGRIASNEVAEKLKEADVLLVIGNNSDSEVPSKLFEYLSFCKPIIHLYYSEKDAYITYLKKHPCAISIKIDENCIKENTEKVTEFCKKATNAKINYEEIEMAYKECTPKYVAGIINDEFHKGKK